MPIFDRNDREVVRILDNQGREIETVYDQNGAIVYTNAVEMTGNTPLYFKGRGKPLTDYLISGETLQDGTPSPDMPVDVVGCGVRTENLFQFTEDMLDADNWVQPSAWFIFFDITDILETKRFGACIFPNFSEGYTPELLVCAVTATSTAGASSNDRILTNNGVTYIRSFDYSNAEHIYLCIGYGNGFSNKSVIQMKIDELFTNWQIVFFDYDAPSPASYIPYGYKLPITVNGTEYPIYLGQVPTTRRIKKLVLTGEEDWAYSSIGYCISLYIAGISQNTYTVYSTHYQSTEGVIYGLNRIGKVFRGLGSSYREHTIGIGVRPKDGTDVPKQEDIDELKAFLVAQYAAGTPVTVWYVLAEPETGIVNEPLHHIGEYADTVSFAQAGVTIPTVSGANVLDMTSTVEPSQMYIKGKIKPDGYGKLVDKNNVYILDKDGVSLAVHGQTDTSNA